MSRSFLRLTWLALVVAGCTIHEENPATPGPPPSGDDPDAPAPARSPDDKGLTSSGDGGSQTSDAEAGGPPPPPGRVRGLVGVGYGGLRITSRDGGRSWTSRLAAATGGLDDYNLLRAVAYANGMWLATGWCATTSTDGVTWTPLARINQPGGVAWNGASACNLVEGLTSDGEAFYATCGSPHRVFRSTDGANWTQHGTIGEMGGHPAIAFRGGAFYAYGDLGTSFRSTDGTTWSTVPGLTRATFCEGTWKSRDACHGASWFDGAFFQSEWQSRVTRSTDGSKFEVVHDDPSNNTLYQPRAIAEGWVAP